MLLLLVLLAVHQQVLLAHTAAAWEVRSLGADTLSAEKDSLLFAVASSVLEEAGDVDTLFVETEALRVLAGHLFDASQHHLYVQLKPRAYGFLTLIGIYAMEQGHLFKQPLLTLDEIVTNTFVADSLRDVNGDGWRDYVYRFYPASGCCRRYVDRVFLFDGTSSRFADEIELINPTYYPEEGVIRGVNYGHPGDVPLYKLRFAGLAVEQVECIYPKRNAPGEFIRGECDQFPEPEGEHLDSLPQEYSKVEELAWFLDY